MQINYKNNFGFTLVELSIVLVVIGLLIGGILVGQSLIKSAQIQGVVKQLSQYDIAIRVFRDKFRQWPGDSNLFPNPGNEDNLIFYNPIADEYETGNAWYHLSLGAGLKTAHGVDYQPYNYWGINTNPNQINFPVFNIDQNTQNPSSLHFYQFDGKNIYYYDQRPNGDHNQANIYDPLKPLDAMAIDTKIDDGEAFSFSGKVLSTTYGSDTIGNCLIEVSPDNYVFDTNNDNFACSMLIEIGVTS